MSLNKYCATQNPSCHNKLNARLFEDVTGVHVFFLLSGKAFETNFLPV